MSDALTKSDQLDEHTGACPVCHQSTVLTARHTNLYRGHILNTTGNPAKKKPLDRLATVRGATLEEDVSGIENSRIPGRLLVASASLTTAALAAAEAATTTAG